MTNFQQHLFKTTLLSLRSHLQGEIDQLTDMALDTVLDQGRSRFRGFCRSCRTAWRTTLAKSLKVYVRRLIERKEAMLEQIDTALDRLEKGIYAECSRCDDQIPEDWLRMIPYTTLCVACDSQRAFDG
jgi:RNA polymerase-binding transcription factor DksA